jgi:hypothetical protein
MFASTIPLLLLSSTMTQPPARLVASVDFQVEAASIVARLAGYEEFVNDHLRGYAEDVDRHFAPHKDHAVVRLARQLRERRGLSFSQYMAMPVHLTAQFSPKVAFSDAVPHKDFGSRAEAIEFARLLGDFCREADCARFFADHATLYRVAEERFQRILDDVDEGWFSRFFGERSSAEFRVVIGLLNGPGNFAAKVSYPGRREELFAIVGATQADSTGRPIFQADEVRRLIVHEFAHSFVNHVVHAHAAALQAAGTEVFASVSDRLRERAYVGWEIGMSESLVRAAVIRYLRAHGDSVGAENETIAEMGRGFVWMDELNILLGSYDGARTRFPTFATFLPVIAGYFVDLAPRVRTKVAAFDARRPRVVGIVEIAADSMAVDPGTSTLTFVFDRPLRGYGVSINFGPLGAKGFPKVTKVIGYSDDGLRFSLGVRLEPNHEYTMTLDGSGFVSREGYPLQQFPVRFRTRATG